MRTGLSPARAVDQGLQVAAGAGQQHHDITGLGHQ
jgi:hypothetical protein